MQNYPLCPLFLLLHFLHFVPFFPYFPCFLVDFKQFWTFHFQLIPEPSLPKPSKDRTPLLPGRRAAAVGARSPVRGARWRRASPGGMWCTEGGIPLPAHRPIARPSTVYYGLMYRYKGCSHREKGAAPASGAGLNNFVGT